MNFDYKLNFHDPMLTVKYKDNLYKFYSKLDYDNWVKTIADKENIRDCKYYKGLGDQNIK